MRCSGAKDVKSDQVRVEVVIKADIAHGQNCAVGGGIETRGRLQDPAVIGWVEHPEIGSRGDIGVEQISFGKGKEVRANVVLLSFEHIAGNVNRVAVNPERGEIGEISVSRISANLESRPVAGRVGSIGKRNQEI